MSEREFLDIYRDTVGPLYGSVAGWTGGDQVLAEDIVQETFLRAVKTWPAKGVPDNPIAWLRTVARNAWISAGRVRRPEPQARQRRGQARQPRQPVQRRRPGDLREHSAYRYSRTRA